MFESFLASPELVLFWDGESIDKAMMYSDFQATLDGYVGINAYAGDDKHAAYVQLDDGLNVRGCVLFSIGFDSAGFPERSWNLPLRHMVEIAGRGPDMGAGPINLVCRSQCSISWHAPRLWDPVMQPAALNTFSQIAAEVTQACARFGMKPLRPAPMTSMAAMAAVAMPQAFATAGDVDIPVLTESAPPEPVPAPAVDGAALAAAQQQLQAHEQQQRQWQQERAALLEKLTAQQLHINTLETDKNETVARLGFMHQQQLDILNAQNTKLLSQQKALREQDAVLREQVENLQQQLGNARNLEENLAEERRLHEEQLTALMHSKLGQETQKFEQLMQQKEQEFAAREARLKSVHQLALEKRMGEEASRFQLQIDSLRAEINYRDDTIGGLSRELAEVKVGQAQREEGAADEFLHRLEGLGMNFVVFHPGAGHVSVPVPELARYVSNPIAFVADKCHVSEDQYRNWLAHYENPRCSASIGDNKCCDARLIRTDSPTKFVAGQSDRCARHQAADSAIDNVLRFR